MDYVYFAHGTKEHDGLIKIGYTRDIEQRNIALTSCTIKHVVPCPEDTGRCLERNLHRQFRASLEVPKEWFRQTDELLEYIENHAYPWPIYQYGVDYESKPHKIVNAFYSKRNEQNDHHKAILSNEREKLSRLEAVLKHVLAKGFPSHLADVEDRIEFLEDLFLDYDDAELAYFFTFLGGWYRNGRSIDTDFQDKAKLEFLIQKGIDIE